MHRYFLAVGLTIFTGHLKFFYRGRDGPRWGAEGDNMPHLFAENAA